MSHPYTPYEACLAALLSCTGKANIRSMTQLRHFPILYRDLTEAVRAYMHATLSQPSYAAVLKQADAKAGHAEMQALQRLLFRNITYRQDAPVYMMDRVLAKAVSVGVRDAMALLQNFTRSLCSDACHMLRRAG